MNPQQDRMAGMVDSARAKAAKRRDDARWQTMAMGAYRRAFDGVPANDVREVRHRLIERLCDASMADEGHLTTASHLRAIEGRAVKGYANQISARAKAEQEADRIFRASQTGKDAA